jgi:hypothetical protein
VRPSLPAPQESPSSTPQVNRGLLWLIGILLVGGMCLWLLFRRIFQKRVFKLLLLNQSLRRKFVGSRLPTS